MSHDTAALQRLAERAGLQTHWRDAWGRPQALTEDALHAVLRCARPALRYPRRL